AIKNQKKKERERDELQIGWGGTTNYKLQVVIQKLDN
ncbi:MAG: hypothetical protein ACI90V_006374, partial [Bacillariaceae sp.]